MLLVSLIAGPVLAQKSAKPKKGAFPGAEAGDAKEVEIGDGVTLKLRWCPPGNFLMGSPASEEGREQTDDREGAGGKPLKTTISRGFWIGETEVTQGQWKLIQKTEPWDGKDAARSGDDFPASYIPHGDTSMGGLEADSAREFCQKLTVRERKAKRMPNNWEYRLPTEAEWEFACRAGTHTTFSFGDDAEKLGDAAWHSANSLEMGKYLPNKVGLKDANAWGIKDMHGNLSEWCLDQFDLKLLGGKDPVRLGNEGFRTVRGGAYIGEPKHLRSAHRHGENPTAPFSSNGFRIVAAQSK